MIIIEDIEQGTPEWLKLRLGVATASNFQKIVTTNGEPSKSRSKYMYQLAGEILSGEKTDSFFSTSMAKGVEREDESRSYYEFATDREVKQVGFVFLDERKSIGASPDGLVDPDGGFETKNAEAHIQVERHEKGWSRAMHYQQVHGCMWVCQREWWDLQSYSRGIAPLRIRYLRDEKFINLLSKRIEEFIDELNNLVARIRSK